VIRTNFASLFIAAIPLECARSRTEGLPLVRPSQPDFRTNIVFLSTDEISVLSLEAPTTPARWDTESGAYRGCVVYFIVGMTNCAPSRLAVGQREVTVLSRV
jgi:hypothetical protein